MKEQMERMMADCHDEIVDKTDNGDCDFESTAKNDEGEDLGSNNSSTASISSSSSSSLTSADDNNGVSSSLSTSFNDFGDKNLWWIHGHGYDLMDFVKNHPGGVEAILLGKGRDCTALVESYHAFSGDRVWKVLEKYRSSPGLVKDDDEGETTKQGGERVQDFFYEILKKRVTKVLLSKGIDPVNDRGASETRIAYYFVVLVSWLYTGYLHCSVSFFFHCYGWFKSLRINTISFRTNST